MHSFHALLHFQKLIVYQINRYIGKSLKTEITKNYKFRIVFRCLYTNLLSLKICNCVYNAWKVFSRQPERRIMMSFCDKNIPWVHSFKCIMCHCIKKITVVSFIDWLENHYVRKYHLLSILSSSKLKWRHYA